MASTRCRRFGSFNRDTTRASRHDAPPPPIHHSQDTAAADFPVYQEVLRLGNLHHFRDTERVARLGVPGSKRLISDGSLTGRLSLWRGSWMVALVSP